MKQNKAKEALRFVRAKLRKNISPLFAHEGFWALPNTTAQGTSLSWCYLVILGLLGMKQPLLPRQHQYAEGDWKGNWVANGGKRGCHSQTSKAHCKVDSFSQCPSILLASLSYVSWEQVSCIAGYISIPEIFSKADSFLQPKLAFHYSENRKLSIFSF